MPRVISWRRFIPVFVYADEDTLPDNMLCCGIQKVLVDWPDRAYTVNWLAQIHFP